jgi:Protein of unknown function (DUF4238)
MTPPSPPSWPGLTSPSTKKSRQHHVWQQYLRAWSEGGKIYCLQNNRIFHTGTPVLGITTDFYKLQSLTEADLPLLKFLFTLDKAHPIARKHHEMVLQNILAPMLFVQQNREKLNNMSLTEEILDTHNTNAVDNQHTVIEKSFFPLLVRSLDGDLSWYDNNEDCIAFCNFVAAQQLRTRGVKERTMNGLKEHLGVDVSRIWDILALIYGFNVGCSLFLERKKRKLIAARNDTVVPFITSDQPVVNLRGNGEAPPESLSIYYPISPRLALYLGEPDEASNVPFEAMTGEVATYLNLRIAKASHSQVYAQTPAPLTVLRGHFNDAA